MKTIFKIIMSACIVIGFVSCSNLDESAYIIKPANETVIYTESFASELGKFVEKSVTGTQKWEVNSNGYAILTGFISGTYYANEDWLISPEIDLNGIPAAYLTFDHVSRYFSNLTSEATVMVSENYVADSLPTKATWKLLNYKAFRDPGSWDFVSTEQISLTQYAGKKIRIGFKYISTTTKAGTWEIKNFTVKRGEATVDNIKKGTEAIPYTVSESMKNQGAPAWVSGYVVGYLWTGTGTQTNYIMGADTCTQATNILIADTLLNTYIAKSMPVQLPSGLIRTAFNLPANKSLIGKKILLYGTLESYFSAPGLKNVSYGVLPDGTAVGVKPVEPIYSETFANSSKGSFTLQDVLLPPGFTSVWNPSATFGMVATAFKNPTNYASEGWLISPEINLTDQPTAKVRFEHAINFVTVANITKEMTMQISIDNGVNWTPVTIPTYPPGNNWTFIASGDINLAAYSGKKIKIAFVYKSTATKAGTWEVKNFVVFK